MKKIQRSVQADGVLVAFQIGRLSDEETNSIVQQQYSEFLSRIIQLGLKWG